MCREAGELSSPAGKTQRFSLERMRVVRAWNAGAFAEVAEGEGDEGVQSAAGVDAAGLDGEADGCGDDAVGEFLRWGEHAADEEGGRAGEEAGGGRRWGESWGG